MNDIRNFKYFNYIALGVISLILVFGFIISNTTKPNNDNSTNNNTNTTNNKSNVNSPGSTIMVDLDNSGKMRYSYDSGNTWTYERPN